MLFFRILFFLKRSSLRLEATSVILPSDQPIESMLPLDRSEFLDFLNACEKLEGNALDQQELTQEIRNITPILRDAKNPPELKMTCPWYGGPCVEVKLKLSVSVKFSERLLRYSLTQPQSLKNRTEGRP